MERNIKQRIISEIKRTALENGGRPLGREKFEKLTDIKISEWHGKYWREWGDALEECGFERNRLAAKTDSEILLNVLAKLTRKLQRVPVDIDLRMERKAGAEIPSHNAFNTLGSAIQRRELLYTFATEHSEFADILPLISPPISTEEEIEESQPSTTKTGFVYMGVMNVDGRKRYKIGNTTLVDRRKNELDLLLPEKLDLVHYIETDDAFGIEAYWHNRFKNKRRNGEWFLLDNQDIKAFKRRKFM